MLSENKLYIAICDEIQQDRASVICMIQKYLDQNNYIAGIDEFKSGEELLAANISDYNLVILDIFLDKLNGIETAKRLMKKSPNTRIIFCSISNEFASESYDVSALRYLNKPVSEEKLFQTLDNYFYTYTAMRALEYKRNRMVESVLISDVMWIEAGDHKSIIHTKNGDVVTTTLFSHFLEQVADTDFVKPIRYALVSMKAIVVPPTDVLKLTDGTIIPISRKMRQKMKNAYTNYKMNSLLKKGGIHQ